MFILVITTRRRANANHQTFRELSWALYEAARKFEKEPVICRVQVVDHSGKSYFELIREDSPLQVA